MMAGLVTAEGVTAEGFPALHTGRVRPLRGRRQ